MSYDADAGDGSQLIEPDQVLLAEADVLLRAAGFATAQQVSGAAQIPWLLAEDPFFILGVAAGRTIGDVYNLEALIAADFGALIAEGQVGAKRWDAHLVLVASDEAPSGSTAQAMSLQYDLRALRRIVAHGLAANPECLQQTLAPFLPLPEGNTTLDSTPMRELREELVVNGVGESDAEMAIAAFQQDGDLDAL
jgi:hypothetical protein